MRHLILLGALAGAAVFTSSPGAATDGPWCLMTRDIDCSQPSYEMCHFAGSPFGGYCYRNCVTGDPHGDAPSRSSIHTEVRRRPNRGGEGPHATRNFMRSDFVRPPAGIALPRINALIMTKRHQPSGKDISLSC